MIKEQDSRFHNNQTNTITKKATLKQFCGHGTTGEATEDY
jgi:hypothetical protein